MVLLISCLACGVLAFASAVVMQFRLIGWNFLCGLPFVPEERRAMIDSRRLSRNLSVLMYAVAAVFVAGAFALHAQRVSPAFLSRAMLAVLLVALNVSWILFRACDGNEYTRAARASSTRLLLLCNALFLVALLFFSSCSASGAGTAVDPRILFAPPSDAAPYGTPVLRLDPVDGSYVIDVTLEGLDGRSVYLVKENVSSGTVHALATGSVASYSRDGITTRVAAEYRSLSDLSVLAARSAAPQTGGITRREHEGAQRFSASPPADADAYLRAADVRAADGRAAGVRAASRAAVGDGRLFWVENGDGSFVQIAATLRAQGASCDLWVANANYLASSASRTDNRLTLAQSEALAASFDAMKPRMNALFGYERGGAPGGDGGIDGEARVALLVYDIDYDYRSGQTSGVLGYFWGKDLYPDGAYGSIRSNEAELLYFDAFFADAYGDYVKTTLIHEYQHMVNYSRFSLPDSAGGLDLTVPTWYNEMLSMLAEDLVFPMLSHESETDARDSYPRNSRIPYFLANTGYFGLVGLTDWGISGDALYASYGSAYAFGAYLARNWGGVALVSSLMKGNSTGELAIAKALYDLNAENGTSFGNPTDGLDLTNFREAFRRYGEAYVFSGASRPAGLVSFSNESPYSTVDAGGTIHDYDVAGFDIWTTPNWVKHDDIPSLPYALTGPFVWVFENYPLRPYAVDIQSCEDWLRVTGDLSVTVNLPPLGSGVELYLMVR